MRTSLTLIPAQQVGQYTVETEVGSAVITEITSRPEDEHGNYTDAGDVSKLLHDVEIETSFVGESTRLYYDNSDTEAALARIEELVESRLGRTSEPDMGRVGRVFNHLADNPLIAITGLVVLFIVVLIVGAVALKDAAGR